MGQGISVQTQCQCTRNNWPNLLAGMKLWSESRPKRVFSEMNTFWEKEVQKVSSGGSGPLCSVWHHGTLAAHRVWTYIKGQWLSSKGFQKGNNSPYFPRMRLDWSGFTRGNSSGNHCNIQMRVDSWTGPELGIARWVHWRDSGASGHFRFPGFLMYFCLNLRIFNAFFSFSNN